MRSNLDRHKTDLDKLLDLGETMSLDLTLRVMEGEGDLDEKFKEGKKLLEGSFERNINDGTPRHARSSAK